MDIDNDEENVDKTACSHGSHVSEGNSACDPRICSLCRTTGRPTEDIGDCKELKGIKEYIESASDRVKRVRFVCQTCLYKLYTVIDQNRLKKIKQNRDEEPERDSVSSKPNEDPAQPAAELTITEAVAVPNNLETSEMNSRDSLPAAKSPENHTSEEIHHSMDGQATVDEYQEPIINEYINESSLCIDAPAEIDTYIENDKNGANDSVNTQTNNEPNTAAESLPSSQTSSQSPLGIMYEQTESALVTESGGTLAQYTTQHLECCFCSKKFVQQKAYNKHMRTHQTRSGSGSRGRSNSQTSVYKCESCNATFDTASKKKIHNRIHIKRYYCQYCHENNFTQMDYDIHEAACLGAKIGRNEIADTGRMTRSRTRSLHSFHNSKALEDAISVKSARSKVSAKTLPARKIVAGKTRNDDVCNGADDDEEYATSVADTDYTQVNRNVAQWVAGSRFSNAGSKASSVKSIPFECSTESDFEDLSDDESVDVDVAISDKEYDLLMLRRLIRQSKHGVYICSSPDCDVSTETLRAMCLHDVLTHKRKPYFYCRKCKGVFIAKQYLDFHLHLQNFGVYRCYKCSAGFELEHLFQYHLIQHQRNEDHPCLWCGNSYTSLEELKTHCLETRHDPNERKKLITIDPTMTITNNVAPEPPRPKRVYKSTINVMNLPKTPSVQPRIYRNRPKVRSKFLGEIDFPYRSGLNCARTK